MHFFLSNFKTTLTSSKLLSSQLPFVVCPPPSPLLFCQYSSRLVTDYNHHRWLFPSKCNENFKAFGLEKVNEIIKMRSSIKMESESTRTRRNSFLKRLNASCRTVDSPAQRFIGQADHQLIVSAYPQIKSRHRTSHTY